MMRENPDEPSRSDTVVPQGEIESLIAVFHQKDGMARKKARQALVAIGGPAVPALVEALDDPKIQVRWEAAKTLVEIADPMAVDPLVGALEDEEFDVRWLAAEALIALQHHTLLPLLRALVDRSHSGSLRDGAHHILHKHLDGQYAEHVLPVLETLNGVASEDAVRDAAHAALKALEKKKAPG